mmetsp:Transcript_34699/g.91510  ORF Transcript_34699/g.91510 Transcript_34699/m.91510 type:complete len:294 (+) Transcript_34699:827-1708(+)
MAQAAWAADLAGSQALLFFCLPFFPFAGLVSLVANYFAFHLRLLAARFLYNVIPFPRAPRPPDPPTALVAPSSPDHAPSSLASPPPPPELVVGSTAGPGPWPSELEDDAGLRHGVAWAAWLAVVAAAAACWAAGGLPSPACAAPTFYRTALEVCSNASVSSAEARRAMTNNSCVGAAAARWPACVGLNARDERLMDSGVAGTVWTEAGQVGEDEAVSTGWMLGSTIVWAAAAAAAAGWAAEAARRRREEAEGDERRGAAALRRRDLDRRLRRLARLLEIHQRHGDNVASMPKA